MNRKLVCVSLVGFGVVVVGTLSYYYYTNKNNTQQQRDSEFRKTAREVNADDLL